MKKRLSYIIFAILLLPCMFFMSACGCSPDDDDDDKDLPQTPETPVEEFVYEKSEDGNYVYFGYYPQTIKAESVTVSATPDADGYYLGSDGERYAKYTIDVNISMGDKTGEDIYTYGYTDASDGTVMQLGQTYYFKLEKLKWRILSEADGKAFIVCENAIEASAFQPNYVYAESDYYATDGQGNILLEEDGVTKVYANNYKYSELRRFLNNNFYNTAFTTKQKEIIQLTEVDNSAASTHNNANKYACENTEDYVFTLSYQDLINTNYGFSSNSNNNDINRSFNTTDFAKATGAMTCTYEFVEDKGWGEGTALYNEVLPFIGSGFVWTRSPHLSETVTEIDYGSPTGYDKALRTSNSVVPALYITL